MKNNLKKLKENYTSNKLKYWFISALSLIIIFNIIFYQFQTKSWDKKISEYETQIYENKSKIKGLEYLNSVWQEKYDELTYKNIELEEKTDSLKNANEKIIKEYDGKKSKEIDDADANNIAIWINDLFTGK